MKMGPKRTRWLLASLAGVSVVVAVVWLWPGPATRGTAPANNPNEPARTPPAAGLRIRLTTTKAEAAALHDPAAQAWQQAPGTEVLLNRTPRVYQTESPAERPIPHLEVRGLRAGGKVHLRLLWDDPTKNAPAAPARKQGEGGVAANLYKQPTGETSTFADAAAVMVPDHWTGPGFPSLQMGDKATPVRIFYWNASRGAEELHAAGRTTPAPTGHSFPARAVHGDGRWRLTFELPDLPDGYPVGFAVWDGQAGERDGLKCFSIWYVLVNEAEESRP
jgi:DMSO reductase family type II enzyme heme b subunit